MMESFKYVHRRSIKPDEFQFMRHKRPMGRKRNGKLEFAGGRSMWMIVPALLAVVAVAIAILLVGSAVKIKKSGIKMGFRTYTQEDILRHRFSVRVCHKSPAEYDAELNGFVPRMGAPPSHKKAWAVEVEVFDESGKFIRKHLLQKPNEREAEKLAIELKRGFALQPTQEK